MAYILCIETATTNCSVALAKDGELIALVEDCKGGYSHAEKLHNYILEVVKKASITLNELSAIAVSKGPGSYTGLRIGVSSAKGLCYALDIPLIAVPTLTSLAVQITRYKELKPVHVIPMIDARRMEVYTAVFTNDYQQIVETSAKILDSSSFEEYLNTGQTYFIGDGSKKFAEICTHENAEFIHDKLPSAQEMITLSYTKFTAKDFENVTYFEPYYLKDFVAG